MPACQRQVWFVWWGPPAFERAEGGPRVLCPGVGGPPALPAGRLPWPLFVGTTAPAFPLGGPRKRRLGGGGWVRW